MAWRWWQPSRRHIRNLSWMNDHCLLTYNNTEGTLQPIKSMLALSTSISSILSHFISVALHLIPSHTCPFTFLWVLYHLLTLKIIIRQSINLPAHLWDVEGYWRTWWKCANSTQRIQEQDRTFDLGAMRQQMDDGAALSNINAWSSVSNTNC